MGNRRENHNCISVIIHYTWFMTNCHICVTSGCSQSKDIGRNSFSVIHAKPVSHNASYTKGSILSKVLTVLSEKESDQYFLWMCTYVHCMSLSTTKLHEILLSGFRVVSLTNCFISILNFGQISKFKKGRNSQKNIWIKNSCEYALLYTVCSSKLQSLTKFFWAVSEEFRWQNVLLIYWMLVKFQVQKGYNSQEKSSIRFPHLHFLTTSLERLQREEMR